MDDTAYGRTLFVREVFRSRCGREPTAEELEHYLRLLDEGQSRQQVAREIITRCALYAPQQRAVPWNWILLIATLGATAWAIREAKK